MNVVVLSGGFGGAKFVRALVETLGGEGVTAVVNVGDDLEFLGLRVSPDLDSVLYALAEDARVPRPYGALVQEQRRIGFLQADERRRWQRPS